MSGQLKILPLVGAVKVSSPLKQGLIFIEHIPGFIGDVEGKTVQHTPHIGCAVNHAIGGKTLDNAIIKAELVGARLLPYVVPQNLLFIFSESGEALSDMRLELTALEDVTQRAVDPLDPPNQEQRTKQQQDKPENRAVVLCEVTDANRLKPLCRTKKKEHQDQADCYEVLWCELKGLKQLLDDVCRHGESLRVVGANIVAEGGAA